MKRITTHFIVFTALILSGSNQLHAQRENKWDIGVKAGISIPNLTDGSGSNPISSGYGSRLGPDFDVFGEYHFSKLFSLQLAAEYSSQGGKKDGTQAFTTPDAMAAMFPPGTAPQYLYANYKSEAKLNYIMIPLLAKFGWNLAPRWRIYVDAGPFAGFLVYAHNVTSGSSYIYMDAAGQQPITPTPQSFNTDDDVKSQLNTFNFGVSGNVGLSFSVGHSHIFIEGGGNYGFLDIQKNAENGSNNTGAATAMIGYSVMIGRRMPVAAMKEKEKENKE